MIGLPLNDHACLGRITEMIADLVAKRERALAGVAQRFEDTAELAAWVRELPQRDDAGARSDGPRVGECQPSQRLRIAPPDPNCVERAALYLGAAELIDDRDVRQLATIDTSRGLHTIAVENGVPVILDPRVTRNAMDAGLFRLESGPVEMSPSDAVDWLGQLAREPAADYERGPLRVRNGCRALHGVLEGRPLTVRQAPDVAFLLALGEREARLFGPQGHAIARCTIAGLDDIEHANRRRCVPTEAPRNLKIGKHRIKPNLGALAAVGRIGGRLAYRTGVEALRVKLAMLGADPLMVQAMEKELNREGLSLGPLAKPPAMPGTLAAVAPGALAGRWLASRVG